jgi:hypothetical protein
MVELLLSTGDDRYLTSHVGTASPSPALINFARAQEVVDFLHFGPKSGTLVSAVEVDKRDRGGTAYFE